MSMALIQSVEGLNRTKIHGVRENSLSPCLSLSWNIVFSSFWTWTWTWSRTYTMSSSGSWAFEPWLELHCQLSWFSGLQSWTGRTKSLVSWCSSLSPADLGTFQSPYHMNHFLIINLFNKYLHICYWFCISEEPRVMILVIWIARKHHPGPVQ